MAVHKKQSKNNRLSGSVMTKHETAGQEAPGSFQVHGLALSYDYIAGAQAVIVGGATGEMIDALVLSKSAGPEDAVRMINFYDMAAQIRALRISGGRSDNLDLALKGVADEGARRHVLAEIHEVIGCVEDISARNFMGLSARIARKGHFHGIEILEGSKGGYHLVCSSSLGDQTEMVSETIPGLIQAMIDELFSASKIMHRFNNDRHRIVIKEMTETLHDVMILVSRAQDAGLVPVSLLSRAGAPERDLIPQQAVFAGAHA